MEAACTVCLCLNGALSPIIAPIVMDLCHSGDCVSDVVFVLHQALQKGLGGFDDVGLFDVMFLGSPGLQSLLRHTFHICCQHCDIPLMMHICCCGEIAAFLPG